MSKTLTRSEIQIAGAILSGLSEEDYKKAMRGKDQKNYISLESRDDGDILVLVKISKRESITILNETTTKAMWKYMR